ncbi:MAG: recombinase zinc beta ribbon domain-containing protein [Chloroflexi bacterium]|nr:recombinase zinc beta ribbon domain-containing protein [Chloroflexota bacterium]
MSGLAKGGACGKALTGREAKSGEFSYCVCSTLVRQGQGACTTPYLPKERFEALVVELGGVEPPTSSMPLRRSPN